MLGVSAIMDQVIKIKLRFDRVLPLLEHERKCLSIDCKIYYVSIIFWPSAFVKVDSKNDSYWNLIENLDQIRNFISAFNNFAFYNPKNCASEP